MIRKILLASVAVAAMTGAAAAADLPSRKAPVAYAPVAMAYSWTGFYVGGQIGYAWGEHKGKIYTPANVLIGTQNGKSKGLLGGIHAGYNMQSGAIVYGLEADIEASNVRGSTAVAAFPGFFANARIGTQGSLRGRLGFAADRALFYVTGGVAAADIKTNVSTGALVDSASKTKFGWTLGAGVEYAISNNWSVRGEYRYTDFGKHTNTLIATAPGFNYKEGVTDHAVRLGLSYKFGGPSAIVAKY